MLFLLTYLYARHTTANKLVYALFLLLVFTYCLYGEYYIISFLAFFTFFS